MPLPTTLPIWATDIGSTIETGLNVSDIVWQSGSTIRYFFSGSPDLSSVTIGHRLVVTGATNSSNNGTFPVTNVNNTLDYVDVTNGTRSNASDDELSSPASADAISSGAVIQEPSTAKKEQGWLSPEKPPDGFFNWWQNNVYLWVTVIKDALTVTLPLPAITTAERDALVAIQGMTIFNTTLGFVEYYDGVNWVSVQDRQTAMDFTQVEALNGL